jgi:hypothetical protein
MSGIGATAWDGRFDIAVARRGAGRPWAWEVMDNQQDGDVVAEGEELTRDRGLDAARLAADLHGLGLRSRPQPQGDNDNG